ncbi:hypothetical protein CFIICLFH_2731 [Methylobacterium goesingense]|uniref:Uncharacterized protein n=1 Tax=Methylobacterium goesingense TaxID=243690 RepID=A0ABV2L874_9HYPH|nr:hypothetical protein CFIICLFH_2731 [Methylobacterium goesingense]
MPTVTPTTRSERTSPTSGGREDAPMRMLPLLVAFAFLAVGIGYALAGG